MIHRLPQSTSPPFRPRFRTAALALGVLSLGACAAPPSGTSAGPPPPAGDAAICSSPTRNVVEQGAFAVLVFTKTAGTCLAATGAGVQALAALGAANDFRVTASGDANVFSDEGLARFAAVVFVNNEGGVLSGAQQGALARFVQSGKGFVGVHAAVDAQPNWPWYAELVGAARSGTAGVQTGQVRVTPGSSPAAAELPPTLEWREAWQSYRNLDGNVVPLLNLSEAGLQLSPAMGTFHPLAWSQFYDGGRSFFTGLGGTPELFADAAFRQHLLGGLRWAANSDNKRPALAWKDKADAPLKLWEAQGIGAEGKLWLFGGFTNTPEVNVYATNGSYSYDPATDTWSQPGEVAALPQRLTHAGTAYDGQSRTIWVAGGFVGNGYTTIDPISTTKNVWKYRPTDNTWTEGPPLPQPRAGGGFALLGRTLHYFAGTVRTGDTYEQDYDDHWTLNLDDEGAGWKTAARYPAAVNHVAGATLNGLLYGLGGQRDSQETGGNTDAVYAYDPATDAWTPKAKLPLPLGHTAESTFARGGRLMVLGGVTDNPDAGSGKEVGTVLEYDPNRDAWTRLPELPAPRQSPVAAMVNGRLIVTTGDGSNNTPQATTWSGP